METRNRGAKGGLWGGGLWGPAAERGGGGALKGGFQERLQQQLPVVGKRLQ